MTTDALKKARERILELERELARTRVVARFWLQQAEPKLTDEQATRRIRDDVRNL